MIPQGNWSIRRETWWAIIMALSISRLDSGRGWGWEHLVLHDFVIKVEPETKRVVIGQKEDLARHSLEALNRLNRLIDTVPMRFTCEAKIRYLHHPEKCHVEVIDSDRMKIEFDDPQYGVAPG